MFRSGCELQMEGEGRGLPAPSTAMGARGGLVVMGPAIFTRRFEDVRHDQMDEFGPIELHRVV